MVGIVRVAHKMQPSLFQFILVVEIFFAVLLLLITDSVIKRSKTANGTTVAEEKKGERD